MSDPTHTQPDEQEVCPRCHGVGWITYDVPVGHPMFGKAVPCGCRRQESIDKRVGRLRSLGNLEHLKEMTFERFQVDGHRSPDISMGLRGALDTAQRFAEDPKGWLLITGGYGCGKTHLAAAIANARIAQRHVALFVVVPDLLDHLRATYAPSSPVSYDQRFDQVRNVELLILDDLGTQNTTPWAAEKLYQLLNHRYNADLPTVITTNLRIDDLDPRLASRLRDKERVTMVPIYAPDHRAMGRPDGFGSLDAYSTMTFGEFKLRKGQIPSPASSTLARVVKQLRSYAEAPIDWIVLRGTYGVGKTHLAAAVANQIAASGRDTLFLVVSDLLDHLRATFNNNSPVAYDRRFRHVLDARLLVLDDYGSENATAWAQEKVFQLLNHRYVRHLPTILTIATPYWDHLDARILSRLEDGNHCLIIDLDVPPFRSAPKPQKAPRRSTRQRT